MTGVFVASHRHTDTQTHRHTDIHTQTHRHTDTQTHRHTHRVAKNGIIKIFFKTHCTAVCIL